MPTSIWGVAFYVFALFPGVAFIFAREGHRPVGKRSAVRETATVVFVSTICDATVALVVIGMSACWPPIRTTVTTMLGGDLTWAKDNFWLATVCMIAALAATTLLGLFLGSKWAYEHGLRTIWKSEIPRDLSAWQQILLPERKLEVRVGLSLKSGGWVSGTLWDFDNDPDGNPHRTITLNGQIRMRAAGAKEAVVLPETDWVIVEAGDIELVQAAYYELVPDVGAGQETVDEAPPGPIELFSRRAALFAALVATVGGVIVVTCANAEPFGKALLAVGLIACAGTSLLWLLRHRSRHTRI